MQIISHVDKEKWNSIVKSFADWDVYYLCEYAISLMHHGDGKPLLIYYEDDKTRLCYVVMLNDIADIDAYKDVLQKERYFDITTPYGYGGPIVEGDFVRGRQERFMAELKQYCRQNNIITQFIRFHPLYQNQRWINEICEVTSIKDTITIQTTTVEVINRNMDGKNRNMVRKAIKYGITVIQDKGERLNDFIKIYESTMNKNSAGDYYYFEEEYYEYLKIQMKANVVFFYACLGTEIISASIFFYNERYMHYHLSGTLEEYKSMAATNLMLYEAALWGVQRGIKHLHLGGGLGAADGLFGFKKQFNKNGRLPFYIGRNIFDREAYEKLILLRKKLDSSFDTENQYFIQYRK